MYSPVCTVLIITFLLSQKLVLGRDLPAFITPCRKSELPSKLCLFRVAEQVKIHLKDGIPEMQLPSMNPLVVPSIAIENGKQFTAEFQNLTLTGIHKFILKDMNVDLENNRINMDMQFPKINIKSIYRIGGKLLFIQLSGSGPADGNLTNVNISVQLDGSRYLKHGKPYLRIEDIKLDGKYGKPTFLFENLFQNNPELTDQTNKIINENIEDVIAELKPVIDKTIIDILVIYVKRVFSRYSIDTLFPN